MATISKEFPVDASPADVWDALADSARCIRGACPAS